MNLMKCSQRYFPLLLAAFMLVPFSFGQVAVVQPQVLLNERLLVDVEVKDLYKIYNETNYPTTIDANTHWINKFYKSGGNSLFTNTTGHIYVADQSTLTNLTVSSPSDLINNYPADFSQYVQTAISTDGNANDDSILGPGLHAVFFRLKTNTTPSTWYYSKIKYLEVIDYQNSAVPNWTVGPGWDGTTPMVFVDVSRRFVEFKGGPNNGGYLTGSEEWGHDVLGATTPRNRSDLKMLLPDATAGFTVKKLFPLTIHQNDIDYNLGSGAVSEPNISLDGNWVIFSYFHDVEDNLTASNNGSLLKLGADLYAINIAPLVADPTINPNTLSFHRLTQTLLDGSQTEHDAVDKNKDAMNPTKANDLSFNFKYGVVYMHAIEVATDQGSKLIYVSNKRRLGNSNNDMKTTNYNLNLHEALINWNTGNLTQLNQVHYYTTTSALSPANMRDGFSFAYQSTTEEMRSWEIQVSKSNYQWSPGVGYGINAELALHLHTIVTRTNGGLEDWLVSTFYYNQNNNGFGTLLANPVSKLGQNMEVAGGSYNYMLGSAWAKLPRQVGLFHVFSNGTPNDYPSYHGKLSTPRAGKPNQLFAAYTPHTSNSNGTDSSGNHGRYDSYAVSFPNVLTRFDEGTPLPYVEGEFELVLDDQTKYHAQLWHTPVLSHQDRFGAAAEVSSLEKAVALVPHYQNNPGAIHGKPYAVIGTSDLANTDALSREERYNAQVPLGLYDYSTISGNYDQNLQRNVMGLSKLLASVDHDEILGVAVNLTSNAVDQNYSMGYETANGDGELVKLLGVYDVRAHAGTDSSFMATVPSDQPFELQLLDSEYGLKLIDQRSWKSLKAGEVRNDCGGCHNHNTGAAVPFAGTVADGAAYVPDDMVTQTKYVDYDAFCDPKATLATAATATRSIPEYYSDILPGLKTYCGDCHSASGTNQFLFDLDAKFNPPAGLAGEVAYKTFKDDRYYNHDGALASPLFWAARGKRTDNRNNTLYAASKWKYSAAHDVFDLCDGSSVSKAQFVYDLGLWLDHMMPADKIGPSGTEQVAFDRFHPSVNFELALINNDINMKDPNTLLVSYWDDTDFSGTCALEVYVNGVLKPNFPQAVTSNGTTSIDVSTWNLQVRDVIEAIVIDHADNRQRYQKLFGSLL